MSGSRAADRCRPRLRACAAALALASLLAARASGGERRYLAVFVDGRVLPVAGAGLVDESTIRLDLGEGAAVEIPVARIDRVIEAAVDDTPAPIPAAHCTAGWKSQPLPDETPFRSEIAAAARAADLHPWLVAAVVQAESAFDRWAVSRVGARGLMQLMPAVWIENGVSDPHDAAANLAAGTRHLRRLLDRFGDLSLALAAYNAGAATVERAGGVPPYRETRRFVATVLATFCP